GLDDQHFESRRFAHGQIGQDLAVDGDLSLAEAVDKSAIGQPVAAYGSVDALDPERTEIALFGLAVAIGILAGLFDGLDSRAVGRVAAAVTAFGGLQSFLVTGVGGNASLDAGHLLLPRIWQLGTGRLAVVRHVLLDYPGIGLGEHF